MCIRAGIDTYPTRDLARFNEGVCRGAHLHTKPRTGESRRIYAISGHGLRRQSVPWHSRGSLNLGDHAGEALCANISSLPSSFLRPHPTFSLFLSRSAQRIENAWARAFAVIGGSFGSVWTNDDLPIFLVLGYYTYTIMVVIGSMRFREQSKGSLLVLRCVVTRQKCYSRDHGIYICLRTGCVSFLLSVWSWKQILHCFVLALVPCNVNTRSLWAVSVSRLMCYRGM